MLKTALCLGWLGLMASWAESQILNVGELNTRQIAALDPAKTVVLLSAGILEEHGPYLPAWTDGYQGEARRRPSIPCPAASPEILMSVS